MLVTPAQPPRRRRRWWLLLLLPFALLPLLPLLIDAESFRGKIEQALTEASGWQAELGRIDLSVWRGLKLTVEPLSLVAPDGGSRFEARRVTVDAAWAPLLRGELMIDSVELTAPEIRLVRSSEAGGWEIPLATAEGPAARSTAAAPAVSIGSIIVREGRFLAEDRSVEPARRLALNELRFDLVPAAGSIEGSGRLDPGEGELRFTGGIGGAMRLELNRIAADAVRPWLGEELMHAGGALSGTVDIDLPSVIRGSLDGAGLRLLAGAKALDDVRLEFEFVPHPTGWTAKRIAFRSDEVELRASGELLPLALEVELPPTELAAALAFTDAILPLGLDLRAPGSVGLQARLSTAADGSLRYRAQGSVEAAALHVAEILPPIEQLRGRFTLSPAGELKLVIEQAQVGGGALGGDVLIDRIEPLGTLTFSGGLESAAFGSLIAGLMPEAAQRIEGLAGFSGSVSVDLSREEIAAGSLGGKLNFSAQGLRVSGLDLEAALRDSLERKLGGLAELAGKLGVVAEPPAADPAKTQRLVDRLAAEIDFSALPWPMPSVRLASGDLTAEGAGSFDPLTGQIDLDLVALIDAERSAEYVERSSAFRRTLDEKGRIRLPLQLSGPMTAPRAKFDLSRLARGEDPREKAKSLLDGLLKKR